MISGLKNPIMTYKLQRTQQLYCNTDTAWEFFSSPYNLARITPHEMNFRVLTDIGDKPIYEGMIIEYKISPLMRIPLHWRTKITQVSEGKSFTDFQERGPYKLWNHFHEFTPNEKGVLMSDTVEYALPFGYLGRIAHHFIVARKLQKIFEYRYQVLEKLFNQTGK